MHYTPLLHSAFLSSYFLSYLCFKIFFCQIFCSFLLFILNFPFHVSLSFLLKMQLGRWCTFYTKNHPNNSHSAKCCRKMEILRNWETIFLFNIQLKTSWNISLKFCLFRKVRTGKNHHRFHHIEQNTKHLDFKINLIQFPLNVNLEWLRCRTSTVDMQQNIEVFLYFHTCF